MKEKYVIRVHHDSQAFTPRIKYVFDFISNHPIAEDLVEFRFSKLSETFHKQLFYQKEFKSLPDADGFDSFFIPAQQVLFRHNEINTRELVANAYRSGIYTLYSVEKSQQPLHTFESGNIFQFDWIEMIFFHISRYEEYYCSTDLWDEWDMMDEKLHFLVRNELDKIPVVDHLVYCLLQSWGVKPSSPRTRIQMSHDIDVLQKHTSIYKLGRASAKLFMQGKGWRTQWLLWQSFLRTKIKGGTDPYDSFDDLLSLPQQAEKVLYLMSGGITRFDNLYQITDKKVSEIIALAQKNQYEIGLHPSYATDTNSQLWAKEKEILEEKIGKTIIHSRQHFLHYSFEETPQILEENKIQFDSTLGYQNRYGFRCGTGFPFKLYCFEQEREYSFWEIPMIVMDVGWLRECGFDTQKAIEKMQRFLDENSHLTQITFNFHNTIFDPTVYDKVQMKQLYFSIAQMPYL